MGGRLPLSDAALPRPEYGGMILSETFGNFAFAIACRVLGLRDIGLGYFALHPFLVLTGIETLALRMQRHSDNALRVAQHLKEHDAAVPGFRMPACPATATHDLACKYCPKGAGGVMTFGVKGGYDAGVSLVSKLKPFSHLANIGDTRSLVIHPASTTHRQLTDAQKIAAGAGPEVVAC